MITSIITLNHSEHNGIVVTVLTEINQTKNLKTPTFPNCRTLCAKPYQIHNTAGRPLSTAGRKEDEISPQLCGFNPLSKVSVKQVNSSPTRSPKMKKTTTTTTTTTTTRRRRRRRRRRRDGLEGNKQTMEPSDQTLSLKVSHLCPLPGLRCVQQGTASEVTVTLALQIRETRKGWTQNLGPESRSSITHLFVHGNVWVFASAYMFTLLRNLRWQDSFRGTNFLY